MVITSLELAPSATGHHLGTSHSTACWVSRQSVPCDICQIVLSLHLKHQMGVSSEWSRSVLPGQLVSARGAALKSHRRDVSITVTSGHVCAFPDLNVSVKCGLENSLGHSNH